MQVKEHKLVLNSNFHRELTILFSDKLKDHKSLLSSVYIEEDASDDDENNDNILQNTI